MRKKKNSQRGMCCLIDVGTYNPGDPPPSGYNQWQEWAAVQDRAGLRQKRCCVCRLYWFPQEMSTEERVSQLITSGGQTVEERKPVCLQCSKKKR